MTPEKLEKMENLKRSCEERFTNYIETCYPETHLLLTESMRYHLNRAFIAGFADAFHQMSALLPELPDDEAVMWLEQKSAELIKIGIEAKKEADKMKESFGTT